MISVIISKIKSNSTLLRNAVWSLSGQVLPLIAAIFCMPILISNLGAEKFGFLAIAWMIIGYFSLFDFGLGRAITYIVSKFNAENKDVTEIVNSSMLVLLSISIVVCFVFYLFSDYIVINLLSLSDEIVLESISALKVLSLGLPFVILSIGLKGVLEGCNEFKKISLVSMPIGTLFFLAPTLISLFISDSLVIIFLSLVIVRGVQFLSFLFFTRKIFTLSVSSDFNLNKMKELFKFGGWMTVSNIVSPIMVNMDRFFIGIKIAVSSVTYYVVPFDMITKMLIFPGALSGVLFPDFSKKISTGHIKEAKDLLKNSILLVILLVSPLLFFVYYYSYNILFLWISEEFAIKSFEVLRILCIGVFINAISFIPFAFIQGAGRSDITAKFHLIELVLYLPALLFFIEHYGLIGVAFVWVLRVLIDFLLLINFSFRYI